MQHEILESGSLLDAEGRLREPGWARAPLLVYDRKAIRAPWYRIKEWDYYLVTSGSRAIALTIADNSYMGLLSLSFLDFAARREHTESFILPLTRGRLALPADSRVGDLRVERKGISLVFENDGKSRRILASMPRFDAGRGLEAEIELGGEPRDSMTIATPFPGKPRHFYYNRKIIGMEARGSIRLGDLSVQLEPGESFGLLDWGRGVWPYSGLWYWGAAQGIVGGKALAWNIGYGFGDTRAATENMVFFEGRAHKLEQLRFNIPKTQDGRDDFLSPWSFDSSDGRFAMRFRPILDRSALTSLGFLMSDQHQVFGTFSGRLVLDDGSIVEVEDLPGFAEKVRNRW